MNYKRNTRTGLEATIFATPEPAHGIVTAKQLFGLIVVTIVYNRTIIRSKDYQCIFVEALLFQHAHKLANTPVELGYGIASVPHTCFCAEALVWETRYMNIVGGKIDKERGIASLL